MERDDEPGSIGRTSVACQPLFPGKTPMRTLGASKDVLSGGRDKRRGKRGGAFQADRFTADTFSQTRQIRQRGQSFHTTGARGSGTCASSPGGEEAEGAASSGHNTALTRRGLIVALLS